MRRLGFFGGDDDDESLNVLLFIAPQPMWHGCCGQVMRLWILEEEDCLKYLLELFLRKFPEIFLEIFFFHCEYFHGICPNIFIYF